MNPRDVVAVVLAAGGSSRMWPLADKHLLRFAGRPLIARHLEQLSAAGVGRAVIVGNEGNRRALEAEAGVFRGEALVVEQRRGGGMAGAVLDAIAALGELQGPLYITQPHDVVEPRLHAEMVRAATSGDAYAHVAGYAVEGHFPGGYLETDGARVTGIVEKPAPGSEPSDVVTIVAHAFSDARPLFEALQRETEASEEDDGYERALAALMAAQTFRLVRYEGVWQPLKHPWHVLDVMQVVLDEAARGAVDLGPDYRQVEPGVFFGRDVRVYGGAHVVAPAIVGHGTVIGNNALVRGSMVGEGCVVGFSSEVARSYLGAGCQLHANYVGDSVLEGDVLLGFGTITANFRLDERTIASTVRGERIDTGRTKLGMVAGRGAKVGVGTNIMPGVKIGAGAMAGPGLTIASDVRDGARMLRGRTP